MSSKAAIVTALQAALYNDHKVFDASQVMNAAPYDYNTPGLIRKFLLEVANELATDRPPETLNVNLMDLNASMTDTVQALASDIFNVLP